MALLVTLAVLVLLTVTLLAFFQRATDNRRTEASRGRKIQADIIVRNAVAHITSDIREEIATHSAHSAVGGVQMYRPTSTASATPLRRVSDAVETLPAFDLLMRQSVPGAEAQASGHSTTAAAANGRRISTARWGSIRYVPGGFTGDDQAPHWIYVRRDGSLTDAPGTDVAARFAYNVYSTGGLLDMNVAGAPSSLDGPDIVGSKFSLATADLTALGVSQEAIDDLVDFRNLTSTTAAQYLETIQASSRLGHLRRLEDPLFTSNHFLSRQDFLRYADLHNSDLRAVAHLLTHWTREINAPSWQPMDDAPRAGFGYAANADAEGSRNRFLPNVRVQTTEVFKDYKDDGNEIEVEIRTGESLLYRRFSLARLDWIGRNGPQNGGTVASIRVAFGLIWTSATRRWEYAGHEGSAIRTSIKTLNEVAAENRLPNFFELLSAGILEGSLGLTTSFDSNVIDSVRYDHTVVARRETVYNSRDNHVIQIGANIIDQWDSDSFPTRIAFGPDPLEFLGSENIPHLYRFQTGAYRPLGNVGGEERSIFHGWLEPEFWNPYTGPVSNAPTRYRVIQTNGQLAIQTTWLWRFPDPEIRLVSSPATLTGRYIEFTASDLPERVKEPTLLDALRRGGVEVTSSRSEDLFDEAASGASYTGLWLGEVFAAPYAKFLHSNLQPTGSVTNRPSFDFQYHDGTDWVTQQRWMWLLAARGNSYWEAMNHAYTQANHRTGGSLAPLDPRTLRFGVQRNNGNSQISKTPYWDPSTPSTHVRAHQTPLNVGSGTAGWPFDPAPVRDDMNGMRTYRWIDNSGMGGVNEARYSDPDGRIRPGDGRWVNQTTGVFPLASNRPQDRPVMLNRRFHSVAELGYAFRDIPFRSIDFSSPASADLALVDLFSVIEQPALRAGVLDINTAPTDVLRTVIHGILRGQGLAALTDAEVSQVANAVEAARPFLSRGDLAKVASRPEVEAISLVKNHREALVRALADVAGTRTWNLNADIVAQVGRFPSAARTGPAGFHVESESRVWLLLAIDRYTGRTVAQEMETVLEH